MTDRISLRSNRVYSPVSKRHQSQFFDGAVNSSRRIWLLASALRISRRQSVPAVMSTSDTKQSIRSLLRLSIALLYDDRKCVILVLVADEHPKYLVSDGHCTRLLGSMPVQKSRSPRVAQLGPGPTRPADENHATSGIILRSPRLCLSSRLCQPNSHCRIFTP